MLKRIILICLAAVASIFLAWFFCIPLSPNSLFFWIWLVAPLGTILLIASFCYDHDDLSSLILEIDYRWYFGLPPFILIVFFIFGSPIFSAEQYATILNPTEASFADFSDKLLIEDISLMDTESATRVGSRELGSLSDVVSQFDDDEYYQIIVDEKPQKVSSLQYVSFFSWLNNHDKGTPGYVSVDPIRQDADYYKLTDIDGTGNGMRYIPSAHFGENLRRHVWAANLFSVLGKSHFELDDEGHPYYITQVLGFKTFMGAHYVESIIITDPTDGSMEKCSLDELPNWLDVVYDGDLLDEMYDWYGAYSSGFINSIFGQSGCTRTGGDYGYVNIDGEQWIYTGVTSMGNDASNIGFLLASEKTAEAYFLPMSSADEASAMISAEGKVQQYGYTASFPSLVSIDGQPTYVMVLKDNAGLIRLYAFVNAESYNIVACEGDLVSTREAYENAMTSAGIEFEMDSQSMPDTDADAPEGGSNVNEPPKVELPFTVTVLSHRFIEIDGKTYLYLSGQTDDHVEVFRIPFKQYQRICMLLNDGDTISGTATPVDDIYYITSVNN